MLLYTFAGLGVVALATGIPAPWTLPVVAGVSAAVVPALLMRRLSARATPAVEVIR
jgi:amino acid transporter